MTTYTYVLRERGSPLVRYVGQSGYPAYRLVQHQRSAAAMPKPTELARWLTTADVEVLELVGYVSAADARKAERDLIETFLALGHPLFNQQWVPADKRIPTRKPADATSIAA
jgi:hypothetical protein